MLIISVWFYDEIAKHWAYLYLLTLLLLAWGLVAIHASPGQ